MPKKEYGWKPGEPPPYIEAHSLTKHKVLEQYLFNYLHILTQHPMASRCKLTLVDGFAGGGVYRQHGSSEFQLGSPLQFLKTAEAALASIPLERQKRGIKNEVTLDLQYYFVEKAKKNHAYLRDTLIQHGYQSRINQDVFLINDKFEAVIDTIIAQIKARGRGGRCIFVLDQYGYSQVYFPLIKKIMQALPNAEIVMTIMTDWLIDYLADDPRYVKSLETAGLHEYFNVKELIQSKQDGLEWRRIIQYQLHDIFKNETGAEFYTPFFIVSNASHKSYWLVHLSSHVKAQDEMKRLHWELSNHFAHYGTSGLNMLGYDAAYDALRTGQMDLSFDYVFDDLAKDKTVEVLNEELPRLIYQYQDGIVYTDFISHICNETPATSDIIKTVSEHMIQCKELVVTGPNGEKRTRASTIRGRDVLSMPRQIYIDFK